MEKIKAEMHDKLVYMLKNNYFDGTIRAYLKFVGQIEKNVLSQALKFMIDEIPILHSNFQYKISKPYWQIENYNVNDAIYYEECNNPEEIANNHIINIVREDLNIRVNIKIFSDKKTSIMLILIDHMCMDGEDFKYFIKMLFKKYNSIINNESSPMIKKGSRSIKEIYHDFTPLEKIKAKCLIPYHNYKKMAYFPWDKEHDYNRDIIVRKKLKNIDFLKLRKHLKNIGATINDAVLASMIKSLYELDNSQKDMAVATVVDLRRYIKNSDLNIGLTNYSSLIGLTIQANKDINLILNQVYSITKAEKEKKYFALPGISLLDMAFKYLPFCLALPIVEKNYVDAKVTLSNMGPLNKEDYQLLNLELKDFYITGATKHKPYFLMSCTSFNNELSLSTSIKGNKTDQKIVEVFLDKVLENLKKIN